MGLPWCFPSRKHAPTRSFAAAAHLASGAPTPGIVTLGVACWNIGIPDSTSFARDVDAAIEKVFVGLDALMAAGVEMIGLHKVHTILSMQLENTISERFRDVSFRAPRGDGLVWRAGGST